MKRGNIRLLDWNDVANRDRETLSALELNPVSADITPDAFPDASQQPGTALEEAKLLLRIAAEVEGALMVEYLYAAYSILPSVTVDVSKIDHQISSDDWYDLIRDIARQEMGHLITVQNILLSLNAVPHVDRENFPIESDLYPFPFHLQSLSEEAVAEDVAAEAPREIREADRVDYLRAVATATSASGRKVSRAGQIYERLYFLFQDEDVPQAPWETVTNPFPSWKRWHIDPKLVGFNQDRQAQPTEWRGADASASPDSAVYVLIVSDKASARDAIYRVALQGEGPVDGVEGQTHFDKFLRIYREFRACKEAGRAAGMVRNQAKNPTVAAGESGSITDTATLAWAKLANCRYQMLLRDISLALSIGPSGFLPSTTAARRDFIAWAFGVEMLTGVKKLGEELRSMPLRAGSAADSVRAGLPFEVPEVRNLATTVPEGLDELRELVGTSAAIRKAIRDNFKPTPKQQSLLTILENADRTIATKIGGVR